jgi:dihydrofolate reductase
MEIGLIVAIAENNIIGGDNKLLWHLPADMKYFKNLTSQNIIIMGRKTYDSIGKPLPNRDNIVISRDKKLQLEGCYMAHSLEVALEIAKRINDELGNEVQKKVYIIGGEQIYKLSMDIAQKLYITELMSKFEGDAFFPKIDDTIWEEASRENHKKDEKNHFDYAFVVYNRRIK